nr:MAG TPA: hypothetical protein [Caudoviricetes sp.]
MFTYSALVWGWSWFDDVGRSGGLPTEGLRGNPLTIP